ncbi:MAG TPA: UvrD-helicase domain-containing protein [Solirubrobacteraceae bacterium]|nr:UvrD-helicase domain-containing protein [Solirubrobacteraceae bacterium]
MGQTVIIKAGGGASGRAEELLGGLNEPQRAAVTHGEGPLLILAGAGSGKTRVLTHRLAYLVFSGQAAPDQILAITFTNKAAREMRERAEALLQRSVQGLWIATFHSVCARMLRAHAELLGYTPSFTIYDQADSRRVVKRVLESLDVDTKRFAPALLQSRISQAKNELLSAGEVERSRGGFEELLAETYSRYERELQSANALDFDDLLRLTVRLFERHPEVRSRYALHFRHILIDEYQDTNLAQYRIVRLLADRTAAVRADAREELSAEEEKPPGARNLAVVGDDAQSIYGFRGADVRNILDFEADFPEARVIRLEQNYRSTQHILDAANALIANNSAALPKRLWSELGAGEPVRISELEDEHAEARYVVGEIERQLEGGRALSEIAVFYRTNAMSRVLEEALVRNQIPYRLIGAARFYERAEIKDALAYLSLLVNPRDSVAFLRAVATPRRGVGASSLARLQAYAAEQGLSLCELAASAESVPGVSRGAARGLRELAALLDSLRARIASGIEVAELIAATLRESGMIAALQAEDSPEAQGRIENLEQLVALAAELAGEPAAEPLSLERFLEQTALAGAAEEAQAADGPDGAVTLTTLHNAKGSEYPVVFIIGCEEGMIPHSRAIEEGGLEEERRLFYVGLTRAMRLLHLTRALRRYSFGASSYTMASRFLDELPAEQVLAESLVQEGWQGASRRALRPAAGGLQRSAGRRPAGAGTVGCGLQVAVGDDVLHDLFGEGVVTALDGPGAVVVRFASDGSERTLLTEYANLRRL